MANYPFVLNGVSYTLPSFDVFAYTAGIPASLGNLVKHLLLLHTGTSATSVLIGTGSKSFTTQTGLAIHANDNIVIANTAAPQTNRMFGIVTSYNFATGSLVVNVLAVYGSGTLSAWLIGLGGVINAAAVGDTMLAVDQGGTGFGRDANALAAGSVGLDPGVAMAEIYEEFAGSQGDPQTAFGSPGVVNPPWAITGATAVDVFQDPTGGTSPNNNAGYFGLAVTGASRAFGNQSASLQYGQSGYLHVGKGAVIYETNVFKVLNTYYSARMGLTNRALSSVTNIFGNGGIGFEAASNVNNGRYVLVCGRNGSVSRLSTGVTPSTLNDRLRFEVDHDGYQVDYYINGSYVGSISGYCPLSGPDNLVAPGYETQCVGINSTQFYIDSLHFRKYLLR